MYLGMYNASNLTYKDHITVTIPKVFAKIGIFGSLRTNIPIATFNMQLYNSIVQSHLDCRFTELGCLSLTPIKIEVPPATWFALLGSIILKYTVNSIK